MLFILFFVFIALMCLCIYMQKFPTRALQRDYDDKDENKIIILDRMAMVFGFSAIVTIFLILSKNL